MRQWQEAGYMLMSGSFPNVDDWRCSLTFRATSMLYTDVYLDTNEYRGKIFQVLVM